MPHTRSVSRVRWYAILVATALVAAPLSAQDTVLVPAQDTVLVPAQDTVLVPAQDTVLVPAQDTLPPASPPTPEARRGSEVLIPLGSVFLPGLGQYMHGARLAGVAYSATAVAGHLLGDEAAEYDGDFPRGSRDQFLTLAEDVGITAAMLSAWDSFNRAVPAMQRQGRYDFLTRQETVGDLMTAPFDMRFLRRWTTWVDLGQTVLITAFVLSDHKGDREYLPFRSHDAFYAGSVSLNAAISEEAAFRGWLLPMLHEKTGRRFWAANAIQGTVFGAAHLPDASWYAAVIGGWAMWEGWIVRRNDWSIRESIFHHFWYNTAVIAATLTVEERPGTTMQLGFPTLRF